MLTQFDAAGRVKRVTNATSLAYTRYVYPASQLIINKFTTVDNLAEEAYSATVFDGAQRTRAIASDFPNSVSHYSGQYTAFDVLGRAFQSSNSTEMSGTWVATGDDAAGWYSSLQTFDWQNRPLVTTNSDGTTRQASYGGCGCAGGQVVTLTDEGTLVGGVPKKRQQRIYADVLGRLVKTEILNWDGPGELGTGGTVYSVTANSLNPRDQVVRVRQYQGPESNSIYQETTMSYDGHGRIKTRHLPEQQADPGNSSSTDHTTWDYNADDTLQRTTDARGASQSLSYNARHLVTGISFTVPSGSTIPVPASVSYTYDSAGNRSTMTDGLGSMDYSYDTLSRLTSEVRTIIGLGTFPISYSYNLSGQLDSVIDPFSAQISYAHDRTGQLTSVTGSGFPNVSTYASNIRYRASGALKHLTYGNNRTLDIAYNSEQRAISYQVSNLIGKNYQYHADGTLKYSQDVLDARFDRSYGYDHDRRITQAFSGAEARSEGPTNNRPYRETMAFDALGHLAGRESKHWNGGQVTTTNVYSNNRRTGWAYDADGRLLQSQAPDISYAFDAAGRAVQTTSHLSGATVNLTHTFDGDGQILKRYEVDTIYEEGQPPRTQTSTVYQLRASALGHRLLTEITSQGQKARTYVYANDSLLAWQQVVFVNGAVSAQLPVWEHRDPSKASYRTSHNTAYDPDSSAELDPFESNSGLESPYQFPPPPTNKPNISYPSFGSGFDLACRVDGYDLPCAEALRSVAAGASKVMSISALGDIVGSVQGHEPVEIDEPNTPNDIPEEPENPSNPVTVKPPRTRIEWIPTAVVRLSAQRLRSQNPTPTPTPNPNCGVNPISGQPGFTRNPVGQPGHLRAPINGRGEFGTPRKGNPRGHRGLDVAGTLNQSAVYSNRAGTVSFAGRTAGDGGWMVIINHAGGVETRYAHLQANSVPGGITAGTQVKEGQQIGIVGNTGNAGSAPPHVHFGVRKSGGMVDPEIYLNNPC